MKTTERVKQILSWYASDNPGVLTNLARMLGHGTLGGTGKDAVRLGCSAIGFTIYPGSSSRNTMYEEVRELILEAKDHGLPTVVWSYPRGSGLAKEGEQAIDVTAYAAQIACQLGAHVVK